MKLSIQEQGAFLEGIKTNQEMFQQDLELLQQTADNMQYVSYDGTLIWKITSIREKMSKFYLNQTDDYHIQIGRSISSSI